MNSKIKSIVLCALASFLQGCSLEAEAPSISNQNAENLTLVIYYSDGNFDWKTKGEHILINTGESIQVKRNQIRPDPDLIVHDWNERFLPALEKPPQPGKVPIRLDRKNGVVCITNRCTIVYSICPHISELKRGRKCVSFFRK